MAKELKLIKPTEVLDGPNTNQLRLEIKEVIQASVEVVLLDLDKIEFMNSSGIGALVATLKMVKAEKKELYLCNLTDQVKMILELTKMDRVFTIFQSQEEFEEKIMNA